MLALLDHRRAQLQQEAGFLGERVYAEKPKAFARRLRRYFEAARAEQQARAAREAVALGEATTQAPVV